MFCIKCGVKLQPEAVFCGNCGHEIDKTASETTDPAVDVFDTGISKTKGLLAVKGLIVVLVVIFIGIIANRNYGMSIGNLKFISPTAIPPSPTPTPQKLPRLVEMAYTPSGTKFVAEYVTTEGGDEIWVVEVTELETQITMGQMATFFIEFAKNVDTSHVAWLKYHVVKSGWMPYAYCVRAGSARAAATGHMERNDLMMQMIDCSVNR